MNLFFSDELPASMGSRIVSRTQKETTISPRAGRRSAAGHRTDYEEAGGKKVFQWQPGITPDRVRLDKKGVRVSRRRFGYFAAEGKVTAGRGGA